MAEQVCVDASVILSILLKDQLASAAVGLWNRWIEQDVDLVSAPLFFAEVTSVLREGVYFERLKPEDGEEAFRAFSVLDINLAPAAELQPLAWELAKRFNRPRAYDAQYLAAARYFDCELWTADRRLANGVPVSWLHWLGDFPAMPAST